MPTPRTSLTPQRHRAYADAMPKIFHLRFMCAIPRETMEGVDRARAEEAARTHEPVSRAAMIRLLLRRALETAPQPNIAGADD